MLGALAVIGIAIGCGFAASWVMWRATSKSGLWALVAGVVLAFAAAGAAVAIAWAITRAFFRG